MMMMINKTAKSSVFLVLLFCVISFVSTDLFGAYRTNIFRPQDVSFLPATLLGERKFSGGVFVEHGISSTAGYDEDGKQTGCLKIYSPQQSAQAMLADTEAIFLDSENPEQWFVNSIQQTYDGKWGMFDVNGKFQQTAATLWFKGALPLPDTVPGTFSLGVYLPVRAVHMSDIEWVDHSDIHSLGGEERKNQFTNRLKDFAQIVGKLDLYSWNKVGQGDLTVLLDWEHSFKQELDFIKTIKLRFGTGVIVPTARVLDSDVNQIFSIPLGNDSAWGIPGKGVLEVGVHKSLSLGLGVDVLWLNDVTKTRRIKTDASQTEYLLLSKGSVRMQHARSWRFSLFANLDLPISGFSASALYHFLKTGDHTLVPEENTFASTIINSAESLKESSSHDLVFKLMFAPKNLGGFTDPSLSAFVKVPVGGMRSIKEYTWGGEFGVSF